MQTASCTAIKSLHSYGMLSLVRQAFDWIESDTLFKSEYSILLLAIFYFLTFLTTAQITIHIFRKALSDLDIGKMNKTIMAIVIAIFATTFLIEGLITLYAIMGLYSLVSS